MNSHIGLPHISTPVRIRALGLVATGLLAFGAAACGDDSADANLSEEARRGKDISGSNGCASCHGADGQGGVGPGWIDLAGSERELVDGTVVVADDDYLLRGILEPDAEVVAGFSLALPSNGLTEDEARSIVTYIKELSSEPG